MTPPAQKLMTTMDPDALQSEFEAGLAYGRQAVAGLPAEAPLSPAQRAWLNGFFQGALLDAPSPRLAAPRGPAQPQDAPLTASPEPTPERAARRQPSQGDTLGPSERRPCSRHNPYAARVSRVRPVVEGESDWRLVSLEVAGLEFGVGDWLGVCAQNDPDAVRTVLRLMGAKGQERVDTQRGTTPLWQALLEVVDIERITVPLCDCLAAAAKSQDARNSLLALTKTKSQAWPTLPALLRRFPSLRPDPAEVVACLKRLKPSFYPVASTSRHSDSSLDALVSTATSEPVPRGSASRFMLDNLEPGRWLPVFVGRGWPVPLPDDEAPIVLVTAGAGWSVTRALLQEREARGARGRNWVIAQQRAFTDEMSSWQSAGRMTRWDCCQQSTSESLSSILDRRAAALWSWLVDKCSVYLACDEREADAIEGRLLDLAEVEGRMSRERADDWLRTVEAEGRLHRLER